MSDQAYEINGIVKEAFLNKSQITNFDFSDAAFTTLDIGKDAFTGTTGVTIKLNATTKTALETSGRIVSGKIDAATVSV